MTPRIKNYNTETQVMTISLGTGGEVEMHMDDGLLTYEGPGCDFKMSFIADAAKDICFMINGEAKTALQLIQWAGANHGQIHREALEEEAEEREYIRSTSCPRLSGRI